MSTTGARGIKFYHVPNCRVSHLCMIQILEQTRKYSELRRALKAFDSWNASCYDGRTRNLDSAPFCCCFQHPIHRKKPLYFSKLPRSHSSPSPPSSKHAPGRSDNRKYLQTGQRSRRRQGSTVVDATVSVNVLDWSTSYHAGSSRSASI